ncbi:thiamine phosphate synthase [Brevundimonas sp. GCM10030266]|uniref:thiamine phosphate synthase n=1 Tax=Brevundimonas sp. GCM10030266 TaxID=3273386 RepID=UPI0036119AF3
MNRSNAEALWRVASDLAREAAKVSRGSGVAPPNLPPLLFFTDPARTPEPWTVAARLPVGSGVVYRHFGAPDARDTALRLREATRKRDGLLLIGRDAELAEAVEADGVHLPEARIGEAPDLAARRPDWRITAAFHALTALPPLTGIDALIVSPVFEAGGASASKPSLGLQRFGAVVRDVPVPVYALGGIKASNAAGLIGSGACGIAGVGSIREAFGP